MNFSNFFQNLLVDGLFRGGALNSTGTVNSTNVVAGVWAASSAYTVGQVVVPGSGFTGAGGKFLKCTTAGTSGTTTTLAVPNPGQTLTDGTVTWTAVSGLPSLLNIYIALLVINKGARANSTAYASGDCISLTPNGGAGGDTRQHLYKCTTAGTSNSSQPTTYQGVPGEAITDGTAVFTELSPTIQSGSGFPAGLTEVTTTSSGYARVNLPGSLANWCGTQGATSTTTSTGTSGTTSNNSTVTYGSPTAAWANGLAAIGALAMYDQLTAGNLLDFAPLAVPKTVNAGDASPSFSASSLAVQFDN